MAAGDAAAGFAAWEAAVRGTDPEAIGAAIALVDALEGHADLRSRARALWRAVNAVR